MFYFWPKQGGRLPMSKKRNKKQLPQKKQTYSVYESDINKSLISRLYEIYAVAYMNYCNKMANNPPLILQFSLELEFYHDCIKEIENILEGTPFSCHKVNYQKYMKNFNRKEKAVANKAFKIFIEAENDNNADKERFKQSQMLLSRLLSSIWALFEDFAYITGLFAIHCLPLAFTALKFCRNINYRKLFHD